MTMRHFSCSLKFAGAWRATPDQIDSLLDAMAGSFSQAGVEQLRMGGDLQAGSLDLSFCVPEVTDPEGPDLLDGIKLVVKALNSGRVLAPGWPTNEIIADAIASVRVLALS